YTYRLFSLLKSVSASSQNPSCWPVSAEVANYTHTNESRQHHLSEKTKEFGKNFTKPLIFMNLMDFIYLQIG
ncbi:hypothetical protein HZU77_009965, partial [Neisseriaceae bacterium TC5R-5]|nr:hypothetical protein [Neisseriaceae bacterium TC5R-5]